MYDAASDRILCFGLAAHEAGSRVMTAAVSERGAELVHDEGELPVGPSTARHDFGCIFGADPSRGVCVGLGRERLWERDPSGSWRAAADVPATFTSDRWYPGAHDAAYDTTRSRLLFHWLDWREFKPRLLSWDGASLAEVSTAGLPKRFSKAGGAALAASPEHGVVLVYGGGAGVYAPSDDLTWQRVADAAVPMFTASRALYATGDGALWVGPGTYSSPAGHPCADHAFYRDGVRIGPPWRGAGSAAARRLLAWHAGAMVELRGDWLATATDGTQLWAIAADGAVSRRAGDEWQPAGPAHERFAGATSVAAAPFSGGLIAVVERPDGERVTLVSGADGWREIAAEEPPYERTRKNYVPPRTSLLADRRSQRTLRYNGGEAFELQGDVWTRVPKLDVGHDEHQPVLVQDTRSGRALAVRPAAQKVLSIESERSREVATIEAPAHHFEPDAWDRARPLGADWTFDPETRELTLWTDDELDERFALPLGPLFDSL